MSAAFQIQTVCECQAVLEAELDEHKLVLSGWARGVGAPASARESAPANSVGSDGERFDVVWQCPMCGRNSLRTFHDGAMQKLPSVASVDTDSSANAAAD